MYIIIIEKNNTRPKILISENVYNYWKKYLTKDFLLKCENVCTFWLTLEHSMRICFVALNEN